MTNKDFNEVVDQQLDYCADLLQVKNEEYKSPKEEESDRFHNFKVAAELQGCTMKQALAGMMAKHSVSVYDMCQGGEYTKSHWIEKITDSINYLLILRAMIEEEEAGQHVDI